MKFTGVRCACAAPALVTLLLATGCGEDQGSDVQPASAQPPPTVATTETIQQEIFEPEATYIAEAEAEDGATERIELELGELIEVSEPMPLDFPDPSSICTVDADRDAVIPARVRVTNTTERFAIDTNVAIAADWPDTELLIVGATEYSDGPICREPEIGDDALMRMQTTGSEPGETSEQPFFFVIHDYFSPEHPQGNRAALAATRLNFTNARSDSSGVWERTCFTGPGLNDGWFTFDGSDALAAEARRYDIPLDEAGPADPEPECSKEAS